MVRAPLRAQPSSVEQVLPPGGRSGIIEEMGLRTDRHGDRLRGEAQVWPELWLPGTEVLRMSVLATWADILTGLLSGLTIVPRIAVTLDLDIQLYRQPLGRRDVLAEASVVKAGRNIVVCAVRFSQRGDDTPFAVGHASFMASPDPAHVHPGGFDLVSRGPRRRLTQPLRERVGARVLSTGTAEVPRHPEGLNATGGIQGGLVALAAEEAATSWASGSVLTSLGLRYLRPFRAGPVRAVATVQDGLASVHITDEGRGSVLGAVATGRLAPATG